MLHCSKDPSRTRRGPLAPFVAVLLMFLLFTEKYIETSQSASPALTSAEQADRSEEGREAAAAAQPPSAVVSFHGLEEIGGDQPWTVRSQLLTIDAAILREAAMAAWDQPRIALSLFEDVTLTIEVRSAEFLDGATVVLHAVVPRTLGGFATITVQDDAISGFISVPALGRFTLRSAGERLHRVTQIDPRELPTCGVNNEHHVRSGNPDAPANRRAQPANMPLGEDPIIISLYAVATPAAVDVAGGLGPLVMDLQTDVATTNTILANSMVNVAIKLVHTDIVVYEEQGMLNDIANLRDQNLPCLGLPFNVHQMRAFHCADLVTMIVSYELGGICGVAFVMQDPSPLFAHSAFSVVRYECMPGTVLAHELGHNMGCAHDHFAGGAGGTYPYSHGHRYIVPNETLTPDDLLYATVMTYPPYDVEIPHFSNPRVEYPEGFPTGIVPGPPTQADNARTITNNTPYISMFGQVVGQSNCMGDTWHVPQDFPTIQAAIDAASHLDLIIVHPGVYPENINLLGKAIIVRSIDENDPAIVASTIIDGQSITSVVTCDSGEGADTIIAGFTIRNGSAYQGGGFYIVGSSPSVSNCVIETSAATFGGGGLYVQSGNPTLFRTHIVSNTATMHGGGIFSHQGNPTLIECTVSNNVAVGGRGGGMYAWGGWASIAEGTVVQGNQALAAGGGVYSEHASISISHSHLEGNTANRGAGMYAVGGLGNVHETLIENNIAAFDGGGALLEFTLSTLSQNTFLNNVATSGDGGGIFVLGGAPQIEQCTLLNNEAATLNGGRGGGLFIHSSDLLLTESTVNENIAGINGGGIYVYVDTDLDPSQWVVPTIQGTLICHNTPNNIGGSWTNPGGNQVCALDIDINVPADYSTIQAAINAANTGDVIVVAPGIYPERINFHGKAIHVRSFDPTDPTIVEATTIDGHGGTVVRFENGETHSARLNGFTITGGSALHGGGVRMFHSGPTIENCIVLSNSATSSGGGIAVFTSSGIIRNSRFIANHATSSGGGLYIETSPMLLVQDCIFYANHSNSIGGAMASLASNHVMTNLVFEGNTANQWGGGVFNGGGGNPTIQAGTFSDNTAGSLGGALYSASGSAPSIVLSLFCANSPAHIHGPWTNMGGNTLLDICPPLNNSPENAEPIGSPVTSIIGSFHGATNSGSSTCDPVGVDVFYSYTVFGGPSNLAVDTCGSSGATNLAVFDSFGAELACNTDCTGTPCGGPSACITLPGLADGEYLIRVSRTSTMANDLGSDEFMLNLKEIKSVLGDLNLDGVVDVSDLLLLLSAWGPCSGCAGDLNGDGTVDVSDLLILLGNWG